MAQVVRIITYTAFVIIDAEAVAARCVLQDGGGDVVGQLVVGKECVDRVVEAPCGQVEVERSRLLAALRAELL